MLVMEHQISYACTHTPVKEHEPAELLVDGTIWRRTPFQVPKVCQIILIQKLVPEASQQ